MGGQQEQNSEAWLAKVGIGTYLPRGSLGAQAGFIICFHLIQYLETAEYGIGPNNTM